MHGSRGQASASCASASMLHAARQTGRSHQSDQLKYSKVLLRLGLVPLFLFALPLFAYTCPSGRNTISLRMETLSLQGLEDRYRNVCDRIAGNSRWLQQHRIRVEMARHENYTHELRQATLDLQAGQACLRVRLLLPSTKLFSLFRSTSEGKENLALSCFLFE